MRIPGQQTVCSQMEHTETTGKTISNLTNESEFKDAGQLNRE